METVDLDVADRVAILTLDDPDRRNALTATMVGEIVAAVDELESRDDVGALIVTGAPPAFCAGADLGDLASADEKRLLGIYEGFLRVARTSLPTIAAVNGAAVGAGLNLALACDVRLVAPRARFITRFLDIGLHPGGGNTWLLTRAVGYQRAAALLLFGEELRGAAAVDAGLALRCVEADELLGAARELAVKAASAPPELSARVKATLQAMAGIDTHADAVRFELGPQVWSTQQPFFRPRS